MHHSRFFVRSFLPISGLSILNGSNLLYLLEKHGHQARINLNEAKQENKQMLEAGITRKRNLPLE